MPDLRNVNVYGEPLSDLACDWQRTEQLLRTFKFLSMTCHHMLELGHGSHFCKNIVRAPVAHTLQHASDVGVHLLEADGGLLAPKLGKQSIVVKIKN